MTPLRIVTNTDLPHSEEARVEYMGQGQNAAACLHAYRRMQDADIVLIHGLRRVYYFLCLVKWLRPRVKTRIVVLDFVYNKPQTFMQKAAHAVKKMLLQKIDAFYVYIKKTEFYQKTCNIPASKFVYIPFRPDNLQLLKKAQCEDHEMIFSGGRSRRDFNCLFDAVRDFTWPVKIVTVNENELKKHGTKIDISNIPECVEMIIQDGAPELFIDFLRRARLVVISLREDVKTQAGIAVCLMAMALKKCVVISHGIGITDVLPEGSAQLFEPGDSAALRNIIERLMKNAAERERVAARGCAYAQSLGTVRDFNKRIIQRLHSDFGNSTNSMNHV